MRSSPLTILTVVISSACIDSFNLNIGSTIRLLSVDGMITTDPGPYTVKLFWSSTVVIPNGFFGTMNSLPTPVSGAQVTIVDDQGLAETLQYQGKGVYETSSTGMHGVAGRTYHLDIITTDGQNYSSTPEFLAPPGEIDSAYFQFKYGETVQNGIPVEADGFTIFVDAKANSMRSLLRWNWTGTYKVFTHPELEQTQGPPTNPPVYSPAPCYGPPCSCCTCYITERQTVPFLSDNLYISNSTFLHYPVATIPFVARNFYDKYYLEITQLSVTANTYQFWKLVQSQIAGTTSLFQPPIAAIEGNIVSSSSPTTSGSPSALGIFSACGVAKRSVWIYRSDVPYKFHDPVIVESCLVIDPTSTTQMPAFWN